MRIYGLTGGMGCGKSEAAQRFAEHGIPIVNADRVGHALIAPGGLAERAVSAAFGDAILSDGAIDRAKLGAVVFADPRQLQRLNDLVHPILKQCVWEQCASYAADGHRLAIVDAAIIADDGRLDPQLSGLILVLCPEAERVRRIAAQRGLDADAARQRIRAQVSPESKRPLADWVIDNSGTLQQLRRKVDIIVEELQRYAGPSESDDLP